jgi:autophagy-related protein 13
VPLRPRLTRFPAGPPQVYIQPWGAATPAAAAAASSGASSGTLLERWTLRLGPSPAAPLPLGGALTRSQMMRLNPQGVYKRLTLMLRSLYAYVRVLPAYRLFRAARRQRGAAFALAYRLHSTLPSRGGGGAPAPRRMQRFDFTPVDTADGQLHMGVDYQPASAVRVLAEQAAAPLPRTHIIVDYVGGRGGARAQRASEEGPPLGSPLSTAPSAPASLDGTPRRSSWSSTLRWGAAPRLSPGGTSTAPPSPASSPRVRWQDVGAGGAAQLLEGAAPRPGAAAPPPRSYSTPPRPAAGPAPLAPGAAWSPSTRQAPAPAQALAEGSGGDGPAGDGAPPAGSAARRPTAPMRIPGTGTGASPRPSRRLRSSNDLRGLQGEEPARDKPLSAPAVSHVQRPGAVAVVPSAADPPPAATGASAGIPRRLGHCACIDLPDRVCARLFPLQTHPPLAPRCLQAPRRAAARRRPPPPPPPRRHRPRPRPWAP